MKKCVILFIILIAALVYAAISESKVIKTQSNLDKVAMEDHQTPR